MKDSIKKPKIIMVWIISLLVLSGGLMNIFFLVRPVLIGRRRLLMEIFPLEFLHLSRFLTLLTGVALVVSSFNIFKRKKRAFQIAVILFFLSVIFHLTKGLDYAQAIYSAVILGMLILARKSFTVKSSIPDFKWNLIRFGIAAIVVLIYGIAGFWIMDEREFGINFNIIDSIHKTFLYLTLVGSPEITPYTHHARWFIDSLYFITIVGIGYLFFSLFRPAIYRFRIIPHERAIAEDICEKYGRSSQDFFKYWPDKSIFFSPSRNCFIAYGVGGNYALTLGDPVGVEEEMEETIKGFIDFCEENDWGFGFHQALPDFLPIYSRLGLKKLKIGDDAIVDLTHFSLDGKEMKKMRHTLNKLEDSGIHIAQYEPPVPDDVISQLREVSDEWLKIPGRRERGFTLGKFEPGYIRSTPIFAAADQMGKIQAFLNVISSYRKGETTIDLMRHRIDSPNGVMDYLFVKLFLYNKEKGFERFNLGMAPMSGFMENEEASAEEKAVHFFFHRLNFLFSYSGLRQYKAKFTDLWEPRYLIYRNVLDLPRIAITLTKVSELKREKGDINNSE
jgi:phosphatidylglycerol lysyltransferase